MVTLEVSRSRRSKIKMSKLLLRQEVVLSITLVVTVVVSLLLYRASRMTYSIPQTMRAITSLPITPTSTTSLRCPSKSWQVDQTLEVTGAVR